MRTHSTMPRAGGGGNTDTPGRRAQAAICVRQSTEKQRSLDDQVRRCRQSAAEHGMVVEDRHIFSDRVSGRRSDREGLEGLRRALANDEVDVVIILTTSRLGRDSLEAQLFLRDEIIQRGKRAIFVESGVDTADANWKLPHLVHSLVDELMIGEMVPHILAGQEGVFLKGRVMGRLVFGYKAVLAEGELTRRGTVARNWAVDPTTKGWVENIYRWFTDWEMSISRIVRKLNRDGAPLSPSATSGRWTYVVVRRILSDPRYTGRFIFGKTRNQCVSGKKYAKKVLRDQPLASFHDEDLRIVSDEGWYAAQERLADYKGRAGRRPAGGTRKTAPRTLNGLVFCKEHDEPLRTWGHNGDDMACSSCKKKEATPYLFSLLNRRRALEVLCRALAATVNSDHDLVDQIVANLQHEAEAAQRPDPSRQAQLEWRVATLGDHIKFVLDAPGATKQDRAENKARLLDLRAERAIVQRELAELGSALRRRVTVPEPKQVRSRLDHLASVLIRAAEDEAPELQGGAKKIIAKLTGGKIVISQKGERKRQRGWLRGHFKLHVVRAVADTDYPVTAEADLPEIVVNFKRSTKAETYAAEARELYDRKVGQNVIAQRLGISRSLVGKALDASFAAEGRERPDGRARRWTLDDEWQPHPKYERVAGEVMPLYKANWLAREIADHFRYDRNLVAAAVRWWHEKRGLPYEDGRARRKRIRLAREAASEQAERKPEAAN